ncbi:MULTISPECIES: class II fumarate hydratase [Cupriavidus]|jgi:fumarate hydratase, class II|uniref:Fumarate hydratase class II n=1 Tax=Cupriavidus metallidurans TaxID=119219 RepID=A0A482J2Q3_9BURK|nr:MULTISPECIES: class II fumarate hydratase [Cupriavidus]KWR71445.1 class II fumarate hydratase [Cupriavidus sp. SHE]QBP13819.1 class II fumarate hydratase [Cupriavidus metallidurans]QWC91594.1 class II fumarate hydratase [Cupriavidus metallidurans]
MSEKSSATRIEKDSLGDVAVPADHLWGAQTERSRQNFRIGSEKMPPALIEAFAILKLCAARANRELGVLKPDLADAIERAAEEVIAGKWPGEFPLSVWQTGSGTQTNMNLNEVISNRAIQLLGGEVGSKKPVHPNDHVNCSQSSNDSFPTAMHIAATRAIQQTLLPSLEKLQQTFAKKVEAFDDIVKVGRTHLQDAVPLTLGQEFSGYMTQVADAQSRLQQAMLRAMPVPQGGTAVGTGLNAPPGFAAAFARALATYTSLPFEPAPNRYALQAAHDALADLSGALNTTASSFLKIARDFMLLGSGPRAGFAELQLPANEPGSSIMPGKVNPTQAEALAMVCCRVIGNHTTVTLANSLGTLELNAYKPVIIYSLMQSVTLLADAASSFAEHMVEGVEPDRARIQELLERSLMSVTALNPHIGYDKAAEIAKLAVKKNLSLREAAIASGHVTNEQFDQWIDFKAMTKEV